MARSPSTRPAKRGGPGVETDRWALGCRRCPRLGLEQAAGTDDVVRLTVVRRRFVAKPPGPVPPGANLRPSRILRARSMAA